MAGFVDGEGSIGYYARSLRLTVVNTHLPVLLMFRAFFGGAIAKKRKLRGGWRQTYHWVACGDRALHALRALDPFLLEKRKQARLASTLKGKPLHVREAAAVELSRMKRIEFV